MYTHVIIAKSESGDDYHILVDSDKVKLSNEEADGILRGLKLDGYDPQEPEEWYVNIDYIIRVNKNSPNQLSFYDGVLVKNE